MEEMVLQELNEERGYIRCPYSYFKRHKRRSLIILLSAIFSYSNAEKARCNLSFRQFEEKFNLSHGNVARGIKSLKESGEIEQDKRFRYRSSYIDAKRTNESGFIKIELYLYNTKFDIRGESLPRYLRKSEIDVLCLIKTHCSNEKGEGCFVGSVKGIAETVNLSKTTVQAGIDVLLHAGLIYRSEEGRGLNGYKRSIYTVNDKLLRRKAKNFQKALSSKDSSRKTLSKEQRDEECRIERERYYAGLRERAQSRVDFFVNQLNADDTYSRLTAKLRELELRIAKDEVYRFPEIETHKQEALRIRAERAQRMGQLRISEADLIPRYRCPKCEDRGSLHDGTPCKCYPVRGRKT